MDFEDNCAKSEKETPRKTSIFYRLPLLITVQNFFAMKLPVCKTVWICRGQDSKGKV